MYVYINSNFKFFKFFLRILKLKNLLIKFFLNFDIWKIRLLKKFGNSKIYKILKLRKFGEIFLIKKFNSEIYFNFISNC